MDEGIHRVSGVDEVAPVDMERMQRVLSELWHGEQVAYNASTGEFVILKPRPLGATREFLGALMSAAARFGVEPSPYLGERGSALEPYARPNYAMPMFIAEGSCSPPPKLRTPGGSARHQWKRRKRSGRGGRRC